ncbi:MAG: retroviral-like aspartic protease family protein [Candidatus Bathyarchaeia archaeon]
MGHIEVNVRIGNLERKHFIEAKALVDTGAKFTVLSEKIAKELNLPLEGEKEKVSTAKGYDERELTHALIEINGKRRIMPVLVSEQIERILLGS